MVARVKIKCTTYTDDKPREVVVRADMPPDRWKEISWVIMDFFIHDGDLERYDYDMLVCQASCMRGCKKKSGG